MCPTRNVDDLVDFLARDYCDEFWFVPDSYHRIVQGSYNLRHFAVGGCWFNFLFSL